MPSPRPVRARQGFVDHAVGVVQPRARAQVAVVIPQPLSGVSLPWRDGTEDLLREAAHAIVRIE